ncbi:hypothetical protein JCM10213v2_003361 [Rhodosporidiobolus nylandii]
MLQALDEESNRRQATGMRTVLVSDSSNLTGLEALLPHFGSLMELSIDAGSHVGPLPVAVLASLPNLRVLKLYGLKVNGDWAAARFPSLVRLHLNFVFFYPDAFPFLFREDAFPALRALKLRNLAIADETNMGAFPTLRLPFLAQLDVLDLTPEEIYLVPPSIFSASAVVLETSSFSLLHPQDAASVVAVHPRHIALWIVSSRSLDFKDKREDFQQTLSAPVRLCSLPTRPFSLHLPYALYDEDFEAATLHQVEQACEENGIELLWYAGDWDDIFFHFWRYAKNLKAAQQANGEA